MRWLLFFAACCANGQPSHVRLLGIKSNQALLSFTAPSAAACTIEVSESPTFAPLVHDVNPALFSGSDSDLSRSSTVVNNRHRVVVVGSPTSDPVGGISYSRALFSERAHYSRITCAGLSVTQQFTTPAPRVGDIFAYADPFNANLWGNHAWPTFDPSNRGNSVADPQTGVEIRPFSLAGEFAVASSTTVQFGAYTGATGWTSPSNILSYSGSTVATTGNTNPIVLWPDPSNLNSLLYYVWQPDRQVEDFAVFVFAGGSSATSADRQFDICLTIDGSTCFTNSIRATAAQGAAALYGGTGKVNPTYPTPMWADWGRVIPMEHRPTWGTTVSVVTGLMTVPAGPQSSFSTALAVGSKVFVAGSSPTCASNLCTVNTWISNTQVQLAESVTLGNVAYYTLAFGVRLVKVNTAGTLDLSVGFRSFATIGAATAAPAVACDPDEWLTGDGKVGAACAVPASVAGIYSIYWWGDDGTVRWRGFGDVGSVATDAPTTLIDTHFSNFSTFGSGNGKRFSVITKTHPSLAYSIFTVEHTGDDTGSLSYRSQPGNPGGGWTYFGDGFSWTNEGPASLGQNISARAANACVGYNAGLYGVLDDTLVVSRGAGAHGLMYRAYAGQDGGPAWLLYVNTETGEIDRCYHSFDRWAAHHAFVGFPYGGIVVESGNPLERGAAAPNVYLHGGPFQAQPSHVMRSGAWSTNTALPWPEDASYDRTCPTDILAEYKNDGAVGNRCVAIRTVNPCYLLAPSVEGLAFPCPWDASPNAAQARVPLAGDFIVDKGLPTANNSEHLRIVKITDLGDGTFRWDMHRDATNGVCSATIPGGENNASRNTHANGWSFQMAITGIRVCVGNYTVRNMASGVVIDPDKTYVSGHADWGPPFADGGSPTPGNLDFVTVIPGSITNRPLTGFEGFPLSGVRTYNFSGFGATGLPGYNVQSYMKAGTYRAYNAEWTIDGGALSPFTGSIGESEGFSLGLRSIAAVGGTSQVYKIGVPGTTILNPKFAPLQGWAGRYLLAEKSSAALGNTLTDADSWRFCYAYKAGECRSASAAGEIFVSVPRANTEGICAIGQSYRNSPCVVSGIGRGNWVYRRGKRTEKNGTGVQLITKAFSTAGGQYPYFQSLTNPAGTWAVVGAGGWRQGENIHALQVRLPVYRTDNIDRSTYQQIAVRVPASEGATHARIAFGYGQNLFCMERAERCLAGAGVSPFAWESSDVGSLSYTACASDCTISVPARPGVLHYRIEWLSGGNVIRAGPIEVAMVD